MSALYKYGMRAAMAVMLSILMAMTSLPLNAWAEDHKKAMALAALLPPPPPPVAVNRTVPIVEPVPTQPRFSAPPTDEEIVWARVFEEPLIPSSANGERRTASENENQALADALIAYLKKRDSENLSPLTDFLKQHPESRWRASLLANMGLVYRRTGWFSPALEAWEEAWKLGKDETEPKMKAVTDRAVGELAQLNASLGRYERLETLFKEIEGRDLSGPATEKIAGAREGLWLMRNEPEKPFRCGPTALSSILREIRPEAAYHPKIIGSRSTAKGMSLVQVTALAEELEMNMQAARREPGAEFLLPSVVHWKLDHFAAVLKKEDRGGKERYLVKDPTFGMEMWISREALEGESSGYFIAPKGKLPEGWREVGDAEGGKVWGKGNTTGMQSGNTNPSAPSAGGRPKAPRPGGSCPRRGMAEYDFQLALAGLHVFDTPVGYSPPRGPSVDFTMDYSQREAFQPSVFTFSNLGPKWTFDWISYVIDDPTNPGQTVTLYQRRGGIETYKNFNQTTQQYAPEFRTQAVLVRTSPTSYEKRFPDGSKEIFNQPDGAMASPRRIFLTRIADPQGNEIAMTYDSNVRLIAVADAIGQVTRLSYELPSDPLKITRVTDPFGRFARMEYNASGQLVKITDVIGISSSFAYESGDSIKTLTTPYGTTTFVSRIDPQIPVNRFLQATDPMGDTERVEFRHDAPGVVRNEQTLPQGIGVDNTFIRFRNTFFWDKQAWKTFPGDYTKARAYHFLHTEDVNVSSGTLESIREPFESRKYFNYPNQVNGVGNPFNYVGSSELVTKVAKVLEDGSTQLVQAQYNSIGNITQIIDPVGRKTDLIYDANGIDLLETRQTSGGVNELTSSFTYNNQHLPISVTDEAGQTSAITYNAQGQPLSITNAKQETITLAYSGSGYLTSVAGPMGKMASFAYDGFGRVRTVTDSDGFKATTDYDALDRVTRISYPNGTFQQIVYDRLDAGQIRDRQGRFTQVKHDALRRPVSVIDPLGRVTSFTYCDCGGLERIVDPMGRTTTFNRDVQGRLTSKILPDGSTTRFVYGGAGRLTQVIDPKGQITNFQYFADDNIKQISYINAQMPTPTVRFAYDSQYNRILSMTDGNGITNYSYNQAGTVGALQVASIDGPFANDAITFTYDELGRVLSRAVNGSASSVNYDSLGRITEETNPLGDFNFTYEGVSNRLTAVNYPNGQKALFSYFGNTGDRRLMQIKNLNPSGLLLSQFDYAYFAEGSIRSMTRSGLRLPPTTYAFTYDAADQLTSAVLKNINNATLSSNAYAYDRAANISSEQINNSTSIVSTYNVANQLISQRQGIEKKDYAYDRNGNLISDGTRKFEWDAADRLAAVASGTRRSEFSYDGLSQRTRIVEKENGAVKSDKSYIWCGGAQPCEERNTANNTVTRRFYAQGEQAGGASFYYTRDHLGSIREMTNGSGAAVARYDYDTYGRMKKTEGSADAAFGYAGYFMHTPSGLNLTLFRAYDPNLGRWLSRDPIGEKGGLNLYGYVGNNPGNFTDPSGLAANVVEIVVAVIVLSIAVAFGINALVNQSNTGTTVRNQAIDNATQTSAKPDLTMGEITVQDANGNQQTFKVSCERDSTVFEPRLLQSSTDKPRRGKFTDLIVTGGLSNQLMDLRQQPGEVFIRVNVDGKEGKIFSRNGSLQTAEGRLVTNFN